jgi:hypothetical protein
MTPSTTVSSVVEVNIFMLSFEFFIVIVMLSVIMLSVIMLSVVVLSVVASYCVLNLGKNIS